MQSSGSDLWRFRETSNCNSPVRDLICTMPSMEKGICSLTVRDVHFLTGEKVLISFSPCKITEDRVTSLLNGRL
jgi:hypothetical protein